MIEGTITPVLKWAGGKRQLINEIEKRLPSSFNKYYEPFVGGGALFMHLKCNKTILGDISVELINVYKQIKDAPIALMKCLDELEESHKSSPEEHFYKIRGLDRENYFNYLSDVYKASRTMYLNKSCFNGLYRVNKQGHFNVPFNKKDVINTYDRTNILNLSDFLNKKDVELYCMDFETICATAKKGDFVYFDPPYDLLKKDTFNSYTKESFGVEEQKRLSDLFKKLDQKGCYVMLTNHNTELINELYKDFSIDVVSAKRMINSNAKNRKGEEVIVYNYKLGE